MYWAQADPYNFHDQVLYSVEGVLYFVGVLSCVVHGIWSTSTMFPKARVSALYTFCAFPRLRSCGCEILLVWNEDLVVSHCGLSADGQKNKWHPEKKRKTENYGVTWLH